ncbi:hypothetical protein Q9L42_004450 [Methylomarinum sp. Ch1-1]|uniref:Uncharacterized protein n=1 Tax=Methylomarinum roseum TaxID=3067653 RepID=A0AAU7NXU3_9GAMM|nr:hypothetical protein [Methylomarinum sp. Ch1-1]MDP4522555.1 hypothetical protein [Methylomarinum sp. Ch1-1]
MNDKNKPVVPHDFQDPGVKKVKRIASMIFICLMAFIVGGSYLHQQGQAAQNPNYETSGFSDP